MSELYIGLISGTSVDGIDAGLVDFDKQQTKLVEFLYQPFTPEFRAKIQKISQPEQPVLLKDLGALDTQFGCMLAEAAQALLAKAGVSKQQIKAIGSHGQTVYHAPDQPYGFSMQIGDPNRIAALTGITTVADFRRRDIAVGGQGAPLVTAFHQAVFTKANEARTILNIGGIANITVLNQREIIGFDTGPGNTLLHYWCQIHCNQAYDYQGEWAASGKIEQALLNSLKDDPYFRLSPPKSTGTEYFSADWLNQKLSKLPAFAPENVQATLCQLTADTIVEAILKHAPSTTQTVVCGGGAHNQQLLKLLRESLPSPLLSTAELGIHPDHVEACAFAWLARQTLNNLPGNLCSTTGAKSPAVLGGIYPGKSA